MKLIQNLNIDLLIILKVVQYIQVNGKVFIEKDMEYKFV